MSSLQVGTKLGPYEIISPIGTGGMGEVYRAKDTRLGRTVAIKILNKEHMQRFEQEAGSVLRPVDYGCGWEPSLV